MSAQQIIRMANQIAEAFVLMAEDRATASVVDHIEHFWDPRMRAELRKVVESATPGLSPIARAAALQIARNRAPA